MKQQRDLEYTLHRIDGRGYRAYKDIQGTYDSGDMILFIDHVQGDPFAAPSKVRVRAPSSVGGLPQELFRNPVRRMALEDFLAREARAVIRSVARGDRGSGKSGAIHIDAGRQEVLKRTAAVVETDWAELRVTVGLPAAGRRVLGRQAAAMLCEELPRIAARALHWANLPQAKCRTFVECVENQDHIRAALDGMGLVAFVADGSILPRTSGASDAPLAGDEAVAFQSPESLRVSVDIPNALSDGATSVLGMGVPKGVTLIVGGGYHGKSTLLKALERGVYPHIPGDGREYVVTSHDGVKIRAEDGRRVESVDISPFISDLPYGRSTRAFRTDDASGSTSQAAGIVEALEVGAKLLLLDEDTSATNFMVRDARMQALVNKEHEPITPFLERVHELHAIHDVSTILVMGGCGDYFDVADTVIMMRDYLPRKVTEQAQAIAQAHASERKHEADGAMAAATPRVPQASSFDPSRGRREVKIDARGSDTISFGTETINLRGVEQLVDTSQTRAVGYAIHQAAQHHMDGKASLCAVVDAVEEFLLANGLDSLDPYHRDGRHPADFALPRRYELAAAINRLRSVRMRQK